VAVAYSSSQSARGTSAAQATPSITVSGTNPVLVIGLTIDVSGGNPTINSVTFGGTGTPVSVIDIGTTAVRTAIWVVPAPSGSGVVTLNLSASKPVQISVSLFTGANQTTPCPAADAVSSMADVTSITLSPANLTANDGSYGAFGHTIIDDCTGVTPNAILTDSTTAVNFQTGYRIGTGSLVGGTTNDGPGLKTAECAVRIAVAAAATGPMNPGLVIGRQAVKRAAYYRAWPVERDLFDMIKGEHNGTLQARWKLGRQRRFAVPQLDSARGR